MLSIQVRIDRAQRLLRMLEQDAALLTRRVAPLTPEYQQSAQSYAAQLREQARAEVEKLMQEKSLWQSAESTPQAAD
jgi:dsDNA-specific endonuclease/ATPase MutS2